MAGNASSNGWMLPIQRSELIEYSSLHGARVRLFHTGKYCKSSLEMAGDGFLRQEDGIRFYLVLDWKPDEHHYLKSGEIIGIQVEGRIDFQPRRLDIG